MSCRTQEMSKMNEKLRLQLAEKDGTISTLSRSNQSQQKVLVSLISQQMKAFESIRNHRTKKAKPFIRFV